MIANELLNEKWEVQKKMALEVNYNISEFSKKVHSEIKETTKKYNLKLNYSDLEYVKPKL